MLDLTGTNSDPLGAFWSAWLNATRSMTCRSIMERHGVRWPRLGMLGWQEGHFVVPVWGCDYQDATLDGDQEGGAVELRGLLSFDPARPAALTALWGEAVLAPWEPFDEASWPDHPVRVHKTLLDALRHEEGGIAILDWSLAALLIPDDAVLLTDDAVMARSLAGKFRRLYGGKRPKILVPAA